MLRTFPDLVFKEHMVATEFSASAIDILSAIAGVEQGTLFD